MVVVFLFRISRTFVLPSGTGAFLSEIINFRYESYRVIAQRLTPRSPESTIKRTIQVPGYCVDRGKPKKIYGSSNLGRDVEVLPQSVRSKIEEIIREKLDDRDSPLVFWN